MQLATQGGGWGVSGTPKPGLVVKYEQYKDCVILLIFSRFSYFSRGRLVGEKSGEEGRGREALISAYLESFVTHDERGKGEGRVRKETLA